MPRITCSSNLLGSGERRDRAFRYIPYSSAASKADDGSSQKSVPIELRYEVPKTPPRTTPPLIHSPIPTPDSPPLWSPERSTTKPTPSTISSTLYLSRHRKDSSHVRRPPNPFILFACDYRRSHRGKNNRELSREAGALWKALPEKERQKWMNKASAAKAQHAEDHPGYRYQPRRRGRLSPASKHENDPRLRGNFDSPTIRRTGVSPLVEFPVTCQAFQSDDDIMEGEDDFTGIFGSSKGSSISFFDPVGIGLEDPLQGLPQTPFDAESSPSPPHAAGNHVAQPSTSTLPFPLNAVSENSWNCSPPFSGNTYNLNAILSDPSWDLTSPSASLSSSNFSPSVYSPTTFEMPFLNDLRNLDLGIETSSFTFPDEDIFASMINFVPDDAGSGSREGDKP